MLQMTDETLNALKGWATDMHALDYVAKLDPSVVVRVPAGSCLHLNSSGNYVPGVGNLKVMPLFNFQASDAVDVINDGGDPATDKENWVGISPSGNMMTLVATGAYELVSTNFDDQVDYAPNDALTSPTVAGGGVDAGMLTKGTMGTNCICGLVSRGVVDNGYGADALAFWPVCLPPNA
jgi:hypothetical protein